MITINAAKAMLSPRIFNKMAIRKRRKILIKFRNIVFILTSFTQSIQILCQNDNYLSIKNNRYTA